MALAKTVTKVLPTEDTIGFHLLFTDDAHPLTAGTVTVIDKDYIESFTPANGASSAVKTEIAKAMQKDINNYIAAKKLCNTAAYETARSQIEAALNLSEV